MNRTKKAMATKLENSEKKRNGKEKGKTDGAAAENHMLHATDMREMRMIERRRRSDKRKPCLN